MGFSYNPAVVILPWPASVECRQRVLTRTGKTTALVSPLTRTTQTQELVGGQWILTAQFPPLDEAQQRAMRVFIAKLRGTQGYFYFPAESTVASIPGKFQSEEGGGPFVFTQGRSSFLNTAGWPAPEGTLLISAGEYVSFDDAEGWRRLHVVVEDCYATWTGEALLHVEPPIRSEVIGGASLHIACPNGIFKLAGDGEGVITQTPESGEISITAVEAFPPRVTVP